MVAFNYEEQEGKEYLVYNKRAEDKIDPLTMEMMSNNKIDGLIPFESIQVDGALTLKYNVTGLESLKDYFSGIVGRKKLIHVLEEIAAAFIEAEDYLLDPSSYVLEEDCIYVHPETKKVFMIVLPFVRKEIKPEMFLKKLLLEVRYDQSEDCSYVAGLINLFSANEGFSLSQFREQLIRFQEIKTDKKVPKKEEESGPRTPVSSQNTVEEPVRQPVPPVSPAEQTENETIDSRYFYTSDEEVKKKKGFFWKKEEKPEKQKPEKKGLFWKKSKKHEEASLDGPEKMFPFAGLNIPGSDQQNRQKDNGKNPEEISKAHETPIPAQRVGIDLKKVEMQDFGETVYIDENADDTFFLEKEKSEPQPKPVLYRYSTQEIYEIQGDIVRIGRNPAISEICISGNRGIGRIHAVLYVKNGQVGIIDNDSKNKTYVNGEQLKPGDDPRILSPGDVIRLADEELEFRISQ